MRAADVEANMPVTQDPRGCRYIVTEGAHTHDSGNTEGADTLAGALDLVHCGLQDGRDVTVTLTDYAPRPG